MDLRTSDVAAVTGGRHIGPDVVVSGAAIDSRRILGGELFVPVVAGRDGHDYVGAALAAGAAAALSDRSATTLVGLPRGATVVEVADTVAALGALGRAARGRLAAATATRVVGVTGSVGKTSVKDLLAGALRSRWRTQASTGSFNNELGVPLTLLAAPADVEAVVVEMGARGPGHVAALCRVARPAVGVVTRVAAAHTATFGSLEGVARAKGELPAALPPTGTAVLNAADPRVAAMARRTPAAVLTYGEGGEVRAEGVRLDDELRPLFRLATPWGGTDVRLGVRGGHMVDNALAAAAAALACDVPLEGLVAGLAATVLSPWRMELGTTAGGARLLNDAYNANPASMAAALRSLAGLDARRRVAVLGAMAELGPSAEDEHAAVGALARSLGIEVVAVGVVAYGGTVVEDIDQARAALDGLGRGDAVLVKGSRVAGLERLAEHLASGPG